ncbi:MAG: hypothetical protein NTX50_18205 [Candidatus Sumerlaeota bacterium]|nr:hypothetical protein [Candidatus Sumerlaeota bacterium]
MEGYSAFLTTNALKGPKENSPGQRPGNSQSSFLSSPVRAEEIVRKGNGLLLSPFQGFPKFLRSVPRALPWAVFFLPFQGITEHRLHLSYYRERADLGEKFRLEAG